MTDRDDTPKNAEDVWFDELRYWPYTIHQIDDTLDSALIEGRAKQILFQALNGYSVTAFVGTGISAAYGRMGWRAWSDTQLGLVERLSTAFVNAAGDTLRYIENLLELGVDEQPLAKPDEGQEPREKGEPDPVFDLRLGMRWLRHRKQVVDRVMWDVRNLKHTFDACKSDKGSFPGGEDYPILFEIAQKLHDLVIRHHNIFHDAEFSENLLQSEADLRAAGSNDVKRTAYFGLVARAAEGAPVDRLAQLDKWIWDEPGHDDTKRQACIASVQAFKDLITEPSANLTFSELAKTLLVDECPHALHLLRQGLSYDPRAGREAPDLTTRRREVSERLAAMNANPTKNLKRDLDGIRTDPDRYTVLGYFRLEEFRETVRTNLAKLPKAWQPLFTSILDEWEEHTGLDQPAAIEVKRIFFTPTSRFLVAVFLQLLRDPQDPITDIPGDLHRKPDTPDFESRRSIVARHLDPLERINDKLGISRFLTTNYDFEIERYFQDKGYSRFDPHHALNDDQRAADNPLQFRTNGFGGVMRDMTFESATATDLLAFTANGGASDASIFHLHGRATEKDNIVATEREYMNMYLRRDPDREVVDESILMAFAANPILFLGLGMTEADVLRPLRQFMSDQDRSVGYRAIVLLPADRDFDARAKMSAGLYLRYGVHTMHYGSGQVAAATGGDKIAIDWMHRIMKLIEALEERARKRLETTPKAEDPEGFRNRTLRKKLASPLITAVELSDKVGNLGPDLLGPSHQSVPNGHPALPLMMGLEPVDWVADIMRFADTKDPGIETRLRDRLLNGEVQNCEFTSQRDPRTDRSVIRRTIELDSKPYVGFYTRQLTALLRIALQDNSGEGAKPYPSIKESQRSLTAMLTALNGLRDGIQTACLNGALDVLNLEWKQWWKDWQTMPPHRESRFEQLPNPAWPTIQCFSLSQEEVMRRGAVLLPRRDVRHKVESVITDLRRLSEQTAPPIKRDTPNTDERHVEQRAFDPEHLTGVRIFDRFIYDVARMSQFRTGEPGRIVTTVDARRGQGKGVFFSTLTTRLGLTSYIRAAHPAPTGNDTGSAIVSAIFINLSFATEVASVYDMLLDSLERTVAQLMVITGDDPVGRPDTGLLPRAAMEELLGSDPRSFAMQPAHLREFNEAVQQTRETLINDMSGLSRFARTRTMLHQFRELAEDFQKKEPFGLTFRPRILICLNAAELLFDAQRRPKNREIADYLDLLSSPDSADIPFDLLTIGSLRGMGHMFGSDARLARCSFAWPELRQSQRATLQRRAEMLGFDIIDPKDAQTQGFLTAFPLRPNQANFVHFARQVEATRFLVDNFPVLAMALLSARETRKDDGHTGWLTDEHSKTIREAYEDLTKDRKTHWFRNRPPDCNDTYLETRTRFNYAALRTVFSAMPTELQKRFNDFDSFPDASQSTRQLRTLREFADALNHAFSPPKGQDERDWNDLHEALSGNRFCLTILLAAAEQLVLAFPTFLQGGEAANQMLENVVSALRNASVGQREETVMAAVMSVNRQLSQFGNPERDHDLHQLLLRNIAVLGCPVSPNVLVRLPDIRAYFNQRSAGADLSRRRMVAQALAALAERGLVFRVSPHPKLLRLSEYIGGKGAAERARPEDRPEHIARKKAADAQYDEMKAAFDAWPADREYRYALHRQIQTYCFQRLGHLTAPPVTANNFAPTLYASMPSRVIRLSTEGYLFLRRLLLGLSQYPDIRHEDAARIIPTFGQDDTITRVQALRAGLSLARTCFSIAAVSRFDKEMTGLAFIRKRGHFDTYRVRLRWILRKAWEVHEPNTDRMNTEEIDRRRVNALYEDEIVWLYNEVAVTCLVQGALSEAIGHIRQAIYLNRRVEGPLDGGRTHNMLSLNCAIIQFERGRLKSAEDRLNQIVASEGEEKYRVANLAKGYLALIAQLRGRRHEAQTRLEKVVRKLEDENQDRSLAIMLHHLGRLVAQTDPDQAREHMRRAQDYAEKGGHEDIRYRILIGEVWTSQTLMDDPQDRMAQDRAKLRDAETYAQAMGLHSLMVDSLHAQGLILLKAGDYSSSGRMMTKAMAIARQNDMTLRLNTTMTNYAKVLLARRRVASAKRLLNASLAIAKRSGYSLEVGRIHTVMEKADRMSTVADSI